ncbi:hypothetical protein DOTSEDRAFT_71071 [Dothistroma septosporum NZE10]|uniref:Uncharacterized protein n=1 Tax=Dothistroma septosporum (strain NZE10 / CBS 128990) TaxID=675120 RepID=N1PPC6_DOTSN|nr:hypothetical protein DOTSEDRAFT_71071 [Dothistroma septosporum NZE10]
MGQALTIRFIEREPRPEILASKVLHGPQDKRVLLQVIRDRSTIYLVALMQRETPRNAAGKGAGIQGSSRWNHLWDPVRAQKRQKTNDPAPSSSGPYSACVLCSAKRHAPLPDPVW